MLPFLEYGTSFLLSFIRRRRTSKLVGLVNSGTPKEILVDVAQKKKISSHPLYSVLLHDCMS